MSTEIDKIISESYFKAFLDTLNGVSQEDIADDVGKSQAAISAYYRGHTPTPESVIKLLVSKYRVNADYLRFGTQPMFLPDEDIAKEKIGYKSTKEVIMIDIGTHIISKNAKGLWERLDKTTQEVEVRVNGIWVEDSSIQGGIK